MPKSATAAALAEGIVPGGGIALLRAEKALEKVEVTGDEAGGVNIIRKVLEYPLRSIAENAGHDGAVVVNRVYVTPKARPLASTRTLASMSTWSKPALLIPRKSSRPLCRTQPAFASLLLTTESLVTDIPKEEEEDAGGHHHDHGMGGDMGMGGMGMPGMGGMGGMGGMPGMM